MSPTRGFRKHPLYAGQPAFLLIYINRPPGVRSLHWFRFSYRLSTIPVDNSVEILLKSAANPEKESLPLKLVKN